LRSARTVKHRPPGDGFSYHFAVIGVLLVIAALAVRLIAECEDGQLLPRIGRRPGSDLASACSIQALPLIVFEPIVWPYTHRAAPAISRRRGADNLAVFEIDRHFARSAPRAPRASPPPAPHSRSRKRRAAMDRGFRRPSDRYGTAPPRIRRPRQGVFRGQNVNSPGSMDRCRRAALR